MSAAAPGRAPRVALTGATGFVGRRLLAHLAPLDVAVSVHARRPLPAALRPASLRVVGGALDAPDTWRTLAGDADLVVHCAGAVRGRTPADFAINHRAVAALCEALAPLPRPPGVLLVSSLVARRPDISDYARSKAEGERVLAAHPGLRACVLRPPAVYGPGDVEMLPLLRAMAAGLGVYPGDLDARVSLLHVDDLCRLIVAWLAAPCFGVTLEPDDGRAGGYRWRDLHAIVAEVAGRRVRAVRLAPALLRALARLLAAAARFGGPAPMLSLAKVRELTAPEWVCAPMPIAVDGWTPRVPLRVGLARLLAAAREQDAEDIVT